MSDRAPYSRVYWSVMDDPKFDGIRSDVRLFGSWALLLVVADMAHPAPAFMPRTVPKSAIDKLAAVGLIDLLDGHLYRVHGLTAERARRKAAATTRGPDGTQTGPKRDPNGEQDIAEQSKGRGRAKDEADARADQDDDGRADLEAFLLITRRAPTIKQRKVLDEIVASHDLTGPQWAADLMLRPPDDPIGAVIEADKEWRAARIEEAKAVERPKPKPRRAPGLPESTREILEHWAAQAKEKAAS